MNDPEFETHLRGFRPAAPSASLAGRIAAALPSAAPPRVSWAAWLAERLFWSAAGAAAAWLLLARVSWSPPSGSPPSAPVAAPAVAAPRVSEEPMAWSDDGVHFIDGRVPARLLRRIVLERHQSADGLAEVRVPREDVIVLPVALR